MINWNDDPLPGTTVENVLRKQDFEQAHPGWKLLCGDFAWDAERDGEIMATDHDLGALLDICERIAGLRALTARQPWAAQIIFGGKDVENRSWRTPYRGLLWIHAAAGPDDSAAPEDWDVPGAHLRGVIIGHAELVAVEPDGPGWRWVLARRLPLPEPVPARGRLGLWRPPGSLTRTVTQR